MPVRLPEQIPANTKYGEFSTAAVEPQPGEREVEPIYNRQLVLNGNGHILGTITAENGGAPLVDIEACAYYYNGHHWEKSYNCGYSDVNGDYDVGGLSTRVYRLEFNDYANNYLREFYNNYRQRPGYGRHRRHGHGRFVKCWFIHEITPYL